MKKFSLGLSVVLALTVLSGCSFTLPQKISVKTGAKYKFTVAELEKDLSSYSPVDSLISSSSSDSFDMYKYNPNGESEIQQLMVKMDMQEIPLDISSYLDNASFSSIGGMDVSKDITIPEAKLSESKEIDLDEANTFINTMFSVYGTQSGELNFVFNKHDSDTFNYIEYKSGYLDITADTEGSISLLHDGVVVTTAQFNNGVAALPLTGARLYRTGMTIQFSDYVSYYAGTVRSGSKINVAAGITVASDFTYDVNIDDIEWGNSSALKNIVVKSGSLKVLLDTNEWQKGIISYDIGLTGAITKAIHGDDSTAYEDTLNDVVISNEKIGTSAAITAHFDNATIDFNENPEFTFEIEVYEIASATIALDDSYSTSYTISQKLPSEALSMIESIEWNSSGITLTGSNNLPVDSTDAAANQLGLKVSSTYFDIAETTQYITAGAKDTELTFMGSDNVVRPTSTYDTVDMTVDLVLPGYNESENTITVKNIEAGQTYSFAVKVDVVLDWEKIVINSNNTAQKGSIATGVNLSSMFSSLGSIVGEENAKSIAIDECDVYLFCDVPEIDGLDEPAFNGKISAFIGKMNDSDEIEKNASIEPVYLLGNWAETATLSPSAVPDLTIETEVNEEDGTEIKTVTTDITAAVGEGTNLASIINAECADGESLCVDYDIKFTSNGNETLTITKDIMNNTDVKSIKLSAIVIVPITLSFKNDVNIDVISLVKSDWEENSDILGRTEPTSMDDLQQIIDMIESVTIEYSTSKIPFICSKGISINIDLDGDGTEFESHEISLQKGSISEKPSKIVETYPLHTTVAIELPKNSSISLPNDMSLGINIKLGIECTDKSAYEIWNVDTSYSVEDGE